jgi:hypothetical protein
VVRPLLARNRDAPVRNVGWSPYLLDGRTRWEVFELLGPKPAPVEPPHVEDLWVRAIRPRRRLATTAERRAILAATMWQEGETLFGAPLASTRWAAYLPPGTGTRSLATLAVPSGEVRFTASCRQGTVEPDVRVTLPLPGLTQRPLPVKDHHLLLKAERGARNVEELMRRFTSTVTQMGSRLAVRVGLSRPFQPRADVVGRCWLMVDGFFSLANPQP